MNPLGRKRLYFECTVDGCRYDGQLRKGLCPAHYQRWRRHGDPTVYGDGWRGNQFVSVELKELPHGTYRKWLRDDCRCFPCVDAYRQYCWGYRRRRDPLIGLRRTPKVREHGNYLKYICEGCRCEPCGFAWSDYQYSLKLRKDPDFEQRREQERAYRAELREFRKQQDERERQRKQRDREVVEFLRQQVSTNWYSDPTPHDWVLADTRMIGEKESATDLWDWATADY